LDKRRISVDHELDQFIDPKEKFEHNLREE